MIKYVFFTKIQRKSDSTRRSGLGRQGGTFQKSARSTKLLFTPMVTVSNLFRYIGFRVFYQMNILTAKWIKIIRKCIIFIYFTKYFCVIYKIWVLRRERALCRKICITKKIKNYRFYDKKTTIILFMLNAIRRVILYILRINKTHKTTQKITKYLFFWK